MRTALAFLLIFAAACGPVASLRDRLAARPPYERYLADLRRAGIHQTPLGTAWIAAGRDALTTSDRISLPHRDAAPVRAEEPAAIAHRLELSRGQVYRVAIESDGAAPLHVFVDLFHVGRNGAFRRVAAIGPPVRHLAFEPMEEGVFVVRIQTALLGAGRVRATHRRTAALAFPVPGHGRRHIQSFFGAARSAGTREHQGIDIFAPRGTPVVAAASGWISSTSPNRLGGNVVWLWDPKRRQTLYYAHLDRHAVGAGQRVEKGDVVGFVGNTGNARTTAPHLHFGIYRRGQGAIDPLYHVVDPPS